MSERIGNSSNSELFAPAVRGGPQNPRLAPLDGAGLADTIGTLPTSQWPWGPPREVRIQLLSSHPEPHATFEIGVRARDGWHSLIGKVYATDHRYVYQVMERLSHAGLGPEDEFSVPRAIAYLPSLRLLLQEKVDGTSARDIFRGGDVPQCLAAAERCGRWLGRFQTLAPASGHISGIERFLLSAERKCQLVCQADGAWRVRSRELLERLRAAAPFLDPRLARAGHGDFCEHQIVFTKDRTVVFDWDLWDVAHPARDVAKFIVSLERLAMKCLGSVRALDTAADAFLRAYLSSGGHPEVPAALPFYKAVFWLKGRTAAIRTGAAAWREQAEIMYRESFRNIAEHSSSMAHSQRSDTLEEGRDRRGPKERIP